MSESCCNDNHARRASREGIPVAITEAELTDQKLGLRLGQGSQEHAKARRRAHLGALDRLLECVRGWVGASGAEPKRTESREQRMTGKVSPARVQLQSQGKTYYLLAGGRRLPGSSFRQNETELPLRSELRTACSSQQPPGPVVRANVEKSRRKRAVTAS